MNSCPEAFAPRDLVVRDEGNLHLMRIRPGARKEILWSVDVPQGRDMQLVGNNRVLVGTDKGFQEHDLDSGLKVSETTSLPGALAARRFPDGMTLVAGTNWQGGNGITFVEIEADGSVRRRINYPEFPYVRLVRRTLAGTYVFASNRFILEGDAEGRIVWRAELHTDLAEPHAWKVFRLIDGRTLVSGGYAANLQLLNPDGSLERVITGDAAAECGFFSEFQIMPNGNIVVVNWKGHGPGNGTKGHQLLEFTPDGRQVWHWKQDPSQVSSLQGLVVLDGLDLSRMHCENSEGVLVPSR